MNRTRVEQSKKRSLLLHIDTVTSASMQDTPKNDLLPGDGVLTSLASLSIVNMVAKVIPLLARDLSTLPRGSSRKESLQGRKKP